ncbi:MAG TPA: hypothetical protein PLN72_08330 [bacterium]|nr:hypothetical protein [bacterium]
MTDHLRDAELQLYLDHQLADRAKLDHLRGCPLCQERLDAYEPLFAALGAAPAWKPSPALPEKVMRRIRKEGVDPLHENLLHTILIIGGLIMAISLSLPYMQAGEYLEEARRFKWPEFNLSWEWLRELNFLPRLAEMSSRIALPGNTILMFAGALLLVLLADQIITFARGHQPPRSR